MTGTDDIRRLIDITSGRPYHQFHVGTCRCGKRQYPSRRVAELAAQALHPRLAMETYRCGSYIHLRTARVEGGAPVGEPRNLGRG